MSVPNGEAFKLCETGEKTQVFYALSRLDCTDIQRLELCKLRNVLISLETQRDCETLKLL